ncbi:tetratricopeptide repeat-containing sensor histidine kinase [Niabella soli]|nr:tetratricopeptide repeat-containing sensor histidine kinase [Niabella soli]
MRAWVYFFVLVATVLVKLLLADCGQAKAQTGSGVPQEVAYILKMPDSKAKVDTIIAFAKRNRKNTAIDTLFKLGFALITKLKYTSGEARLLNAYGVYNRDFSRYAEALDNHTKSLELAQQHNDTETEIFALNNLGVVYRRVDENAKALTKHLEALRLAEKIGDDFSASVSLNSIGNIHTVLGNYADAITYFRRGLVLSEKANNYLGISMNYNNIGEVYEFTGKFDSAIKYYQESLLFDEKIADLKGIAINYNSIGSVRRKQGRVAEAITLFKKAKAITDAIKDRLYQADTYNNLGNAYLQSKQFDSSRQMFFNAIAIAKAIGVLGQQKTAYEGLMKLNERAGRPDSALAYSKLFKNYNDSIVIESNNRHVREMEALYATEKERARVDKLEADRQTELVKIKNQRFFFLGMLVLFLLVLTSGILYYLRYRLMEHNKRLQQELDIRTQIATDLHDDMGSTLSSIHIFSELLRKSGDNKEELLTKIEANARDTLDALDDIIWLVKPSNDKFANLWQHVREYSVPMFESRDICFFIDFPESISEIPLPMDVRRNIFLIIKESVNNLVKYSKCTEATITAHDEPDVISFSIWDNGIGFDPEQLTSRNGVKNMQARARSMNAEIKITAANGSGTQVQFWIKKERAGADAA